jgi:hypothetical protein
MIKPKFTKKFVRNILDQHIIQVDRAIVSRLSYIGESFIINARAKNTYTDQTGNLRSSIGYIVARNGKKVAGSEFESIKDGTDGSKKGRKFIKNLIYKYNTGYVLICVAGMDYAAAVESRGKDVLTGSSLIAKKQLKAAFKSLKSNFKN